LLKKHVGFLSRKKKFSCPTFTQILWGLLPLVLAFGVAEQCSRFRKDGGALSEPFSKTQDRLRVFALPPDSASLKIPGPRPHMIQDKTVFYHYLMVPFTGFMRIH
jgi:hypothetical protein